MQTADDLLVPKLLILLEILFILGFSVVGYK